MKKKTNQHVYYIAYFSSFHNIFNFWIFLDSHFNNNFLYHAHECMYVTINFSKIEVTTSWFVLCRVSCVAVESVVNLLQCFVEEHSVSLTSVLGHPPGPVVPGTNLHRHTETQS